MRTTRAPVLLALLLIAVAFSASALRETPPKAGRSFVGLISGGATGESSDHFTIHVDRYSTPEETAALASLAQRRGTEAVLDRMAKAGEVGWIRFGTRLAVRVPIIQPVRTRDGWRIVALIDRPIGFREQWNRSRSLDYPFGVVVLDVDNQGRGDGRLMPAARAAFLRNGTIVLESFEAVPHQIVGIRPRGN